MPFQRSAKIDSVVFKKSSNRDLLGNYRFRMIDTPLVSLLAGLNSSGQYRSGPASGLNSSMLPGLESRHWPLSVQKRPWLAEAPDARVYRRLRCTVLYGK